MFESLVESSKHGQENTKTGMYMLATGGIYAVGLLVAIVGAIVYSSNELADRFDVSAMIAPPPPPAGRRRRRRSKWLSRTSQLRPPSHLRPDRLKKFQIRQL